MTSPLPGVIVRIKAKAGKSYRRGEILLVIEAMKMENEILAPYDCTVEEVFAAAPQPVQTGDRLLKIIKR
jgi:3-methylcrotonyl-CoA carboxylase alpha subunit